MLTIKDLIADLKRGRIKSVVEYGESIKPRPLPSVTVIKTNKDPGDFGFQIWVFFPVDSPAHPIDLANQYLDTELPYLLSLRKNDVGERVWKHDNNFDSYTAMQELSQNFIRGGLVVTVPKMLRYMSMNV
jgi:hypothetical protein